MISERRSHQQAIVVPKWTTQILCNLQNFRPNFSLPQNSLNSWKVWVEKIKTLPTEFTLTQNVNSHLSLAGLISFLLAQAAYY